MICPNCQSENRDGAKFCDECGFPLANAVAATPDKTASLSKDDLSASASESATGSSAQDAILGAQDTSDDSSMSLPNIAVAGLNADDEGNPIDFSDITSGDEAYSNAQEPGEASSAEQISSDEEFDFSDISNQPTQDLSKVSSQVLDESSGKPDISSQLPEDPYDDEPDISSQLPEDPYDESSAFDDADLTAKISLGDQERLADASYVAPQSSWSSGNTMEMPRVDEYDAGQEKNYRAPDYNEPQPKKKRKHARLVAIIIIAVVVVAALVVGGTYYMELWGGKTLPDVVGRTQTDAVLELESKNFDVTVEQVKSDETEGIVLEMDPVAGARLEEGTPVTIQVSVSRIIPEVVGMQRDEATSLLDEEGFTNIKYVEEKSSEHAGLVLAISPDEGTRGISTTEIEVTVATPYTVPDVSGLSYSDAKEKLTEEGYEVDTQYVYDDSAEEGEVVGLDPEAGTELEVGSTVTILLAKSRASELLELTESYLYDLDSITLDDVTYAIDSVDDISYVDYNETSFTITARAMTELDGETVYASSRERSCIIEWDDDNNIVAIYE